MKGKLKMDDFKNFIIRAYNDGKTHKWESGDDYYNEMVKPKLTPQFNWIHVTSTDNHICKLSNFTLIITKYKDAYDAEIFLFDNGCIFRQENIITLKKAKLILKLEFLKYWKKWINEILYYN